MTVSEKSRLIMTGTISRILTEIQVRGLSVRKYVPPCHACSLGTNCNSFLEALLSYWGYVNKATLVSMIKCPVGYCCQGNETCQGTDSCNTGRSGTMRGSCDQNLTESLFSPNCLPTQICHTTLIVILYFSCAIAYLSILLSVDPSRKELLLELRNYSC